MQVILLEKIANLGIMGDIVDVKSGYARNFLLPKKKALRAIEANIDFFKAQKAQLETSNIKRRSEAEQVAKRMDKVIVSVVRQASEAGHLYGSVRAQDIAAALDKAGYKVLHTQVILSTPIKILGIHKALVVLHPEVSVSVEVGVAQSEEEAEIQMKAAKKQGSGTKAQKSEVSEQE
ncbi:MAG: 50S ribosomal protein L9, partial [Alphaproteobacteria bacterium]